MVLLSRYHAEIQSETPTSRDLSKDEWISSIRNFVELNCDRELSLAQLAGTCGMSVFSVSFFNRIFRKHIGTTPRAYRNGH
ncbi:hypothetical protein PA598K_01232 [Paenibacillus sp. 598K]|nr:hypothetical protein PA598K_01232 [Paenibacillus sp. 598K]